MREFNDIFKNLAKPANILAKIPIQFCFPIFKKEEDPEEELHILN